MHTIHNAFNGTSYTLLPFESLERQSCSLSQDFLEMLETLSINVNFKPQSLKDCIQMSRNVEYLKQYADLPFVGHLDDVAYLTAQAISEINEGGAVNNVKAREAAYMILAAFNHDLVEDSPANVQLLFEFPPQVLELVYSLTDCMGKNRKERKQKTYAKYLRTLLSDKVVGERFALIKSADRLANFVRSIETGANAKTKMYVEEHPHIMRYLKTSPLAPLLERVYSYALFNQ